MNRADRVDLVVADDLRQEELGVEVGRREVVDLPLGIGVRICPAAEARACGRARRSMLPQLPRMLDRSRRADGLVAAEHDERRETRSAARARRTTGSSRASASP